MVRGGSSPLGRIEEVLPSQPRPNKSAVVDYEMRDRDESGEGHSAERVCFDSYPDQRGNERRQVGRYVDTERPASLRIGQAVPRRARLLFRLEQDVTRHVREQ
jgi:hypothetical protein